MKVWKRIQTRLGVVLIVMMLMVSIVALAVAVQVSIISVQRHNQIIQTQPSGQPQKQSTGTKPVNMDKVEQQQLFFNGSLLDEIYAYRTPQGQYLIPLETVLNLAGIPFRYYSAEDTLTAKINGQPLTVKLGEDSFTLGGKSIALSAKTLSADHHILVSHDLLRTLKDFTASFFSDKDALFINHYANLEDEVNKKILLLKMVNGNAVLSDVLNREELWRSPKAAGNIYSDEYLPSPDGRSYVIKSGSSMALLTPTIRKPAALPVSPSAIWSVAGGYLYWMNDVKQTSYAYHIKTGETREIGNYYSRIEETGPQGVLPYGGRILYYLSEGRNYKSVALSNVLYDTPYMFIERKGKTVMEGSAVFSPDRKRILYKSGAAFYISRTDGTGIVELGMWDSVRWVGVDRLIAQSSTHRVLFRDGGKSMSPVGEDWQIVGNTHNGGALYTVDQTLYCQYQGKDIRIAALPEACSYVEGFTEKGPFVAVSDNSYGGVYFIENGTATQIAHHDLLLKKLFKGYVQDHLERSIVFSPYGDTIAVYQREKGFLRMILIDAVSGEMTHTTLSYRMNDFSELATISTTWITRDRILAYTPSKAWLLDFSGEHRIYEWEEEEGTALQGVLP